MIDIHIGVGHSRVGGVTFKVWGEQFFSAYKTMDKRLNSPVPYFLLYRSLELFLKAIHLREKSHRKVRSEYGHDLVGSYNNLPESYKCLSDDQFAVLVRCNEFYSKKGFEYLTPEFLVETYSGFYNIPELTKLEQIVEKVLVTMPNVFVSK